MNVMTDKPVTLLVLKHKINFNDADSGDCFAGEGHRVLRVYQSEDKAREVKERFSPILNAAEKETIVWPVQKHSREFKNEFGFTLSDIDDGYDFELEVVIMPVIV